MSSERKMIKESCKNRYTGTGEVEHWFESTYSLYCVVFLDNCVGNAKLRVLNFPSNYEF